MYNVLILDSGMIDREMIQSVLTKGLVGPVEFFPVINNNEAEIIMNEHRVDLLIIDVKQNTALVKKLVRTAHTMHSDVKVILTSVMNEEQIACLANNLNATGYLLKPFLGNVLLQMVQPLECVSREVRARAGENERTQYLKRINACIEDCKYKEATDKAKEYIDFLYDSGDNMSVIRMHIVQFIAALAELGLQQNADIQKHLSMCLERFRSRYDLQSNRFDVALVAEEMLDIIFSDLEQCQMYSDDELKKVLNYIDRNIKKGINLDEAAEYVHMSPSYFSKFFKKSTGTNFIKYVTNRKIEFAKEMLVNTDMPVINIAYELAYNETNYFSKAFKKKVGMTPTEYRKAIVEQPNSIVAAGA